MTFSSLKLAENKCVVIAVPSWYMGFALYTSHYNSRNQLRYGTLHGNGIGSASLKCSFNAISQSGTGVFHIPHDKDYIDVSFSSEGIVTGFTGLAGAGDISSGGVKIGNRVCEGSGSGPWSLVASLRYYRTETSKSFVRSEERRGGKECR